MTTPLSTERKHATQKGSAATTTTTQSGAKPPEFYQTSVDGFLHITPFLPLGLLTRPDCKVKILISAHDAKLKDALLSGFHGQLAVACSVIDMSDHKAYKDARNSLADSRDMLVVLFNPQWNDSDFSIQKGLSLKQALNLAAPHTDGIVLLSQPVRGEAAIELANKLLYSDANALETKRDAENRHPTLRLERITISTFLVDKKLRALTG